MFYFAYGININKFFLYQLLGERPSVLGMGILDGYVLDFCVKDSEGFVWLGIRPKKGSVVLGRVYEIPGYCVRILNNYEEVPELYRLESVSIKMGQKRLLAAVYIPSCEVKNCVVRGEIDPAYKNETLKGLCGFPKYWRSYVCSLFDAC